MSEYFDNVDLDDKVWAVGYGWGKVWACEVNPPRFSVRFGDTSVRYRYNGYESGSVWSVNQTLFWDEITITPPPKPKRKVTYNIERWVNVYKYGISHQTYLCEIDADDDQAHGRILCVKLTGSYSTTED